jgi:hypothetical protein
MQIKTTLGFHLNPIRIAVPKKTTNAVKVVEKGTLIYCW